PRRCGWFDSVITRHACRVNGVDGLGLMKLDVLDGFDQVGLVVGYRDGEGRVTGRVPAMMADWKDIKPEIKYFKGWSQPTRGIQDPAKLPAEAQVYLKALEESVETPIAYLSTGPDRVEGYVAPGSFLEPLLG
ncbi:MAG TPA: adenylosuccinate synthetase, partial [Holophaga sp.]|nr:adenylosuccinate synthetase [Holophaga sp.]